LKYILINFLYNFLNIIMINQFHHDATVSWILKTAVGTLAAVTVLVIVILSLSLFWSGIDSQYILGILGPAINTIIGAFVGLLGGLTLNGHGLTGSTSQNSTTTDTITETDDLPPAEK
jgi:hypothetical protein